MNHAHAAACRRGRCPPRRRWRRRDGRRAARRRSVPRRPGRSAVTRSVGVDLVSRRSPTAPTGRDVGAARPAASVAGRRRPAGRRSVEQLASVRRRGVVAARSRSLISRHSPIGPQHEHGDDAHPAGGDDGAGEDAEPQRQGAVAVALQLDEAVADQPAGQAAEAGSPTNAATRAAGRRQRRQRLRRRVGHEPEATAARRASAGRAGPSILRRRARRWPCVPTYNEADNIELLVRRICATSCPALEILVVDDGSPDGTAELAASSADELGGIDVIERAPTSGPRVGVPRRVPPGDRRRRRRLRADRRRPVARPGRSCRRCSPTSSTAPTSPSAAATCRAACTENWPWRRRWLSRWGNRYAAGVLGLAVNDATAGYRAYRADGARADGLRDGARPRATASRSR